mgnify:CR=1 FL=1
MPGNCTADVTCTTNRAPPQSQRFPCSSNAGTTVVAQPKVPRGASILLVQEPWLGLILSGLKTLEIRGKPCKKPCGERIYLAQGLILLIIYISLVLTVMLPLQCIPNPNKSFASSYFA